MNCFRPKNLLFLYSVSLTMLLSLILIIGFLYQSAVIRTFGYFLTINMRVTKGDAIVLLAGDDTTRVSAAAYLYRTGHAPRILLTNDGIRSGWSEIYGRNLYSVEWTREKLIRKGVPPE